MAEITERIGGRIRQLREQRKSEDPRWTQDYLARQLPGNRTGTEVSRWERGEVKPRDETLEQIAEVLGVNVAEFYAGPTEPISEPPEEEAIDDLRSQLDRIEQALGLLLADRGLEQVPRRSEPARRRKRG